MNLGLNFSLRMYVSWITCKTVVYTIAKVSFTLVTTLLFSLSQHCCNIRYFKYESQAMQIVVAFHRYLGSDFYIQSGFSQIGFRQTWQYLGGIIGIHPINFTEKNYFSLSKELFSNFFLPLAIEKWTHKSYLDVDTYSLHKHKNSGHD